MLLPYVASLHTISPAARQELRVHRNQEGVSLRMNSAGLRELPEAEGAQMAMKSMRVLIEDDLWSAPPASGT